MVIGKAYWDTLDSLSLEVFRSGKAFGEHLVLCQVVWPETWRSGCVVISGIFEADWTGLGTIQIIYHNDTLETTSSRRQALQTTLLSTLPVTVRIMFLHSAAKQGAWLCCHPITTQIWEYLRATSAHNPPLQINSRFRSGVLLTAKAHVFKNSAKFIKRWPVQAGGSLSCHIFLACLLHPTVKEALELSMLRSHTVKFW